ncbi:MAG: preprotein translocase subunit SecD, partial [Ilumatobacteraceae bacterium]
MKRRLFASLIGIVLVAAVAIGLTIGTGDQPSLGLDLQGGASITLQPEGEYDAIALDVAVEIIRSRVDAIGVAEPEIIRQGDTVVVNLPGVKDQQRALDIVGRTGDLQLRPVLQQGSIDPTAGTDAAGTQTPTTPTTTPVGTSVPSETTVPDEGGPGESRGARPMVDTTVPSTDTTVPATDATTTSALPDGSEVLLGRDGSAYLVGPVAATGLVFENNASANIQGSNWSVVVQLRGGAAGEDIWNALTSRCYSRDNTCPTAQIAIVLDGEVISAPVVQEPVFSGGEVQITGDFTEQDARDLAKVLEFGAVPVKFEVSQVQTVSPTLGSDSLRAAIISGLVGLALVFLLMLAYYRFVAVIVFVGLAVSISLQFSIITHLSSRMVWRSRCRESPESSCRS